MNDATSSPYLYQPRQIVSQFPALSMAAKALGLLEEPAFDTSVSKSSLPVVIAAYLPECEFETRPPGESMGPTVITFESLVKDEHRQRGRSGFCRVAGRPTVWVEEIDGKVNMVDLLREFGVMAEIETRRLLTMMKGQSELSITVGKRTLTFSRHVTPGHYLGDAGFVSRDATREYINVYAAVLQSLSLALLLKVDPRFVFIDVFERAREDPLMFSILGALASRSGIDFTDRSELSEYASEYFELVVGEDVYFPNLHQINSYASYFAKHLRLNIRMTSSSR